MTEHPLRTMAERTLCSAIFVCVLVAAWASSARAQTPPEHRPALPGPSVLGDIATTLERLEPTDWARALAESRAAAGDCLLESTLSCTRVVWQVDGLVIHAERWTHRGDSAVWSGLRVTQDAAPEVRAETWRQTDAGADIEGLRVAWRQRPSLRVRRASISAPTSELSIYMEGLAWTEDRDEGHKPVVTARWARYEAKQWRIEGTTVMPVGLALGEIEGETPGIQSGVLPPNVVHAGGDVTEVEVVAVRASSLLGRGIGGYVRGSWDQWYGMGVAVVGHHEPSPDGIAFEESQNLTTLGIVWEPGRRPAVAAEGSTLFGDPMTHLALDMELPGYTRAWRTQSIRRGAYFRDWSLTGGGAALHGPSHALRASAWGGRTYSGRDAGVANGVRAGFGTEHRFGERVDVGLEVAHESISAANRDHHVSEVRTDAIVEFGATNRAFGRVGGLGRLRTQLVPTDVGFGAGTSGGLYAAAEGGLSFTGRFAKLTHRLHPSVFAISEVVDFEKTSQDAINDGLDSSMATTIAQEPSKPWHAAGLRVGQVFVAGAWRVDMPVEAFVTTYGRPGPFADILGGSAGADVSYVASEGVAFSADGNLVCERACRGVAWDVGASLDLGRWDAASRLARANRLSQRVSDLTATSDTWSRILAFELPPATVRLSQTARVGWEHRRFRVEAVGVTDFDVWGASLEPHWTFDSLGWSVGVTGFYDGFDDEWGLLAGLRGR